jgi:D-alanyl-D-alanine carboxypeptidase
MRWQSVAFAGRDTVSLLYIYLIGNISGMSNEEKRDLPDERYDAKLFKQAYKAAKQAREFEKSKRQRDILLKSVIFITVGVILLCLLLYIVSTFKPKSEYVVTGSYPKDIYFEKILERDIEEGIEYVEFDEEISALSAILFNPKSGDIFFNKGEHERRYIASLTKVLTSILVIETFPLDEVIEVSRENIPDDLDWQLGLEEGDRVSVESILKAMLISSYNDAPFVIANAYPKGGYIGFVNDMNSKAKDLRMFNSKFSNPVGIDIEENYSTAFDVALLVTSALQYEDILDIVSEGSDVINWNRGTQVVSKEIYTTNQLWGVNPYSKGLKTGITKLAGQCFIGYFVYPNGNTVISVVLGSEDRFSDTTILERYARGILR